MSIVPQEVIDFLNAESAGLLTAGSVPSMLPDAPAPARCPRCGEELGFVNLYCGGRGYLPYLMCESGECDYMRRATA